VSDVSLNSMDQSAIIRNVTRALRSATATQSKTGLDYEDQGSFCTMNADDVNKLMQKGQKFEPF
jgi:hypothetical protein